MNSQVLFHSVSLPTHSPSSGTSSLPRPRHGRTITSGHLFSKFSLPAIHSLSVPLTRPLSILTPHGVAFPLSFHWNEKSQPMSPCLPSSIALTPSNKPTLFEWSCTVSPLWTPTWDCSALISVAPRECNKHVVHTHRHTCKCSYTGVVRSAVLFECLINILKEAVKKNSATPHCKPKYVKATCQVSQRKRKIECVLQDSKSCALPFNHCKLSVLIFLVT